MMQRLRLIVHIDGRNDAQRIRAAAALAAAATHRVFD